jgi:hypothetical protein
MIFILSIFTKILKHMFAYFASDFVTGFSGSFGDRNMNLVFHCIVSDFQKLKTKINLFLVINFTRLKPIINVSSLKLTFVYHVYYSLSRMENA